MESDDKFIRSIADDVLGVLERKRFFDLLDDRLRPDGTAQAASVCKGDHAQSETILAELGFDAKEIAEAVAVLRSGGGCCDCEVLCNVAEESRTKARYWKARAEGRSVGRMSPSGAKAPSILVRYRPD
jgi:hypothetical protein